MEQFYLPKIPLCSREFVRKYLDIWYWKGNSYSRQLGLIHHYYRWHMCEGQLNCPSGYDESEEECGTARRLLELPGGMFAAFGCLAAAITACLIFCVFGLVRRKRKSNAAKLLLNGSASASASASSASTLHRQHQQQHHYHHPLGSGAGLGGGGLGTYHPGSTAGTLRREKHSGIGGYGKKDSLFMDVDGPTSWQHESDSIEYIHVDRETTVWTVDGIGAAVAMRVHRYFQKWLQNTRNQKKNSIIDCLLFNENMHLNYVL